VGAVLDMPMNVSRDVLKRGGVLRRQAMIARHGNDKRLCDDDRIVQVRHLRRLREGCAVCSLFSAASVRQPSSATAMK
jgi:hypothetical protein